jgi:alkaline phosphatase
MKRILKPLLLAAFLLAALAPAGARTKKKADTPPVKYVFYMIGDGMGINQVIAT